MVTTSAAMERASSLAHAVGVIVSMILRRYQPATCHNTDSDTHLGLHGAATRPLGGGGPIRLRRRWRPQTCDRPSSLSHPCSGVSATICGTCTPHTSGISHNHARAVVRDDMARRELAVRGHAPPAAGRSTATSAFTAVAGPRPWSGRRRRTGRPFGRVSPHRRRPLHGFSAAASTQPFVRHHVAPATAVDLVPISIMFLLCSCRRGDSLGATLPVVCRRPLA